VCRGDVYRTFLHEETAYLMASPHNAQRLNEAIADIESGQTAPRERLEE